VNTMLVSFETLSESERKVTITLDGNLIQEEVNTRLKKLAPKVQINGFRQGKVPVNLVRKRFGNSVRLEVINEMIPNHLQNAIESAEIELTNYPVIDVDINSVQEGDFTFSATLQVFPDIKVIDLNGVDIELFDSSIEESDIQSALETLQKQNSTRVEVDRPSKLGDIIEVDYDVFIDGEVVAEGSARGESMLIGDEKYLVEFNACLVDRSKDEEFEAEITLPEDYDDEKMRGKKVLFKIKVRNVNEEKLPEINDEFAETNKIAGGKEGLIEDIKANLQFNMETKLDEVNRSKIFNKLMELNPLTLPDNLVKEELKNLKHIFFHRMFGNEHHDDEKIPDFPDEFFIDEARRSVHVGILMRDFLKSKEFDPSEQQVEEILDKLKIVMANIPEGVDFYRNNPRTLQNIKSNLTEKNIVEKIAREAKKTYKNISYMELKNYNSKKSDGDEK